MDPSFWTDRWAEGRIGFHEGVPNALLVKHAASLGEPGRVLVPLCGKAEDLAWLATRGHQVIGVELSELAVRAFFAEHALVPVEAAAGALRRFTADTITILCGDIFAATPADIGSVSAFYDRAALVALPPELRTRYVTHLRQLAPTAGGLLITFEYAQDRMAGPPFAVLEPEVRAHFAGAQVEVIDVEPADNPRLQELGIPGHTRCFAITP